MKPSEIFDTSEDSSFWDYFESAWLYPPWIFGSKSLMMDSIFFFIVNFVPFFIIFYSQVHIKKFNNQKHVNSWCALVIRVFQQFMTPVMAIPMTFRLSYLIEQIINQEIKGNIKMIFSLIICILNIAMHIIHTYFSSLFLVPFIFVSHSKADFYDGKYMTLIHCVRIIIATYCFMISYVNEDRIVGAILVGIIFFICFLTLYFRLTIQVHVSPIGQFLEVLPFFFCPFMTLFRYFVNNKIYSLLFLIFLFFVFAIIFRIHRHLIVKQSLKAFSPFMRQTKQNNVSDDYIEVVDGNNNEEFSASFFIGSVISVIRIVASECSDPECLLRFLAFQKKSSGLKNSYMIEVVRFLALFPSRRKSCLKELKNFRSNSHFNMFTVFMFKKILKSLDGVESIEKNLVCLNNFYRSFLVHKHLFWVARKEKKYFVASKEALSAAYFYIEVKNEFHYLMKRYAFDSFLHYYYADFCLSACGNFEGYLTECEIARMLENNRNDVNSSSSTFESSREWQSRIERDNLVDPLLHPMSIVNPKILQFCSIEETKINIPSKNQNDFEGHHQSPLMSPREKKRKYEKSSPVATFLNEKRYCIPLLAILHIYIPIALFCYVMGELYIKDHQIHLKSNQLYDASFNLLNAFYTSSSTIYMPYLSYEYTKKYDKSLSNYNGIKKSSFEIKDLSQTNPILGVKYNKFIFDNDELAEAFFNLPFYMIDFYSKIHPIGNLTGGLIFILNRYISYFIHKNYTIEDVLDTIAIESDNVVKVIFNNVYLKCEEIKKNAIILSEIYKDDLNGFYIFKVSVVTICIFSVVSCIVYIVQINCIYRKDEIKIDFLSSDHLFSLFLLQESKKAWELLRDYVESSSDAPAEVSFASARSSVNLSNAQFNLNDTNLNEPKNTTRMNEQRSILSPTVLKNSSIENKPHINASNPIHINNILDQDERRKIQSNPIEFTNMSIQNEPISASNPIDKNSILDQNEGRKIQSNPIEFKDPSIENEPHMNASNPIHITNILGSPKSPGSPIELKNIPIQNRPRNKVFKSSSQIDANSPSFPTSPSDMNSPSKQSNMSDFADASTFNKRASTSLSDGFSGPLQEMIVNGHDFNKDLRSLANSNNYIKMSFGEANTNLKLASIQRRKGDDQNFESCYNTSFFDAREHIECEGEENDDDDNGSDICMQAIHIARATEKEGFFWCPGFHLVILLFSPLVFTIAVIAMLQVPLALRAQAHERTFQDILVGESLANHSLVLLNGSFGILEKRTVLLKVNDSFSADANIDVYLNQDKDFIKQSKISTNTAESKDSFSIRNLPDRPLSDCSSCQKVVYRKMKNSARSTFSPTLINENSSSSFALSDDANSTEDPPTRFELTLDEILSDLKDLSRFHDEKCYEFIDIVCMSVDQAVKTVIDKSTTPVTIASRCLPFIYLFSWNLFCDLFFAGVNELYLTKTSNGTSFIVATVLLMLTFVHLSFSTAILLKKAFNSLFHFPDDFLCRPISEPKDNSKSFKGKLPHNALVVTSLTKSGEIYSVSDNSKEIINRNLNDLISLKISEVFTIINNNGLSEENLCEFAITDKKRKIFRFSTEEIGCLTKTVLIEENSLVVESPGEQSWLKRLNGFIPQHFAELYSKNDQYEFNFFQNFIICVRISNEISCQMIEKCFNAANHVSQNSISINIISVDGEMITFSSISNCKLIVVLLLIRDFIDVVFKNTKDDSCIYSIYVQFLADFSIYVVESDEPYLRFQPYDQDYFKFRLFQVEKGKIAFSESVDSNFSLIAKITEKDAIPVDLEGNTESVFILPIGQLVSKIAVFV